MKELSPDGVFFLTYLRKWLRRNSDPRLIDMGPKEEGVNDLAGAAADFCRYMKRKRFYQWPVFWGPRFLSGAKDLSEWAKELIEAENGKGLFG